MITCIAQLRCKVPAVYHELPWVRCNFLDEVERKIHKVTVSYSVDYNLIIRCHRCRVTKITHFLNNFSKFVLTLFKNLCPSKFSPVKQSSLICITDHTFIMLQIFDQFNKLSCRIATSKLSSICEIVSILSNISEYMILASNKYG